jgi:hypothetical protein
LSPNRTPNLVKSLKLRLAVGAPALALVAAVGGLAGSWSASTAPAAAAGRTVQVSAQSGQLRAVTLDAFAGSPKSAKPDVSGGGGVGGSGKGKRKATAKQIAWKMLGHFHWSTRQFKYLNRLWTRESGWNIYASNPYSGAYGVPQAVPGSKMASAGPNWRSNARTQVRWGLRYIRDRYGSPRAAWDHEVGSGWY